jgi:Domain of unknown function (DUF4440)
MNEREHGLWNLEREFWLAGADAYEHRLAPEALMVFPAPVGVLDRASTIASIRSAPRWTSVTFARRHAVVGARNVVMLVYRARAQRDGNDTAYEAQCSSTYVERDGAWHLALHHQTPKPEQTDVAQTRI